MYREPGSKLSVSPVAEFLLACRSFDQSSDDRQCGNCRRLERHVPAFKAFKGLPASTVTLIGIKRTVQTVHIRCYCNLKLLGKSAQGKLNFNCVHMFRENKISSVWNPFNKLKRRIQIRSN